MTKHFRRWKVDEAWLLPPSAQEFVPEGHAAHLVRDMVAEEFDLSAILSTYTEPRDYPPYHPAMMGALLLYAYSRGVYSSRRIARGCEERLDFQAVTALNRPDFRTISEFRRRHLAALVDLFVQVLAVCRRAGLVGLGHVAVDGTKLRASASRHRAMSYVLHGNQDESAYCLIQRCSRDRARCLTAMLPALHRTAPVASGDCSREPASEPNTSCRAMHLQPPLQRAQLRLAGAAGPLGHQPFQQFPCRPVGLRLEPRPQRRPCPLERVRPCPPPPRRLRPGTPRASALSAEPPGRRLGGPRSRPAATARPGSPPAAGRGPAPRTWPATSRAPRSASAAPSAAPCHRAMPSAAGHAPVLEQPSIRRFRPPAPSFTSASARSIVAALIASRRDLTYGASRRWPCRSMRDKRRRLERIRAAKAELEAEAQAAEARMVPFILGDDAWAAMPNLKRLLDEIGARPAAERALALKDRHAFKTEMDAEARRHMFRHAAPTAA